MDDADFAKTTDSHAFTNLPVAIGTTNMQYKVVETVGGKVTNVYGYEMPAYSNAYVTIPASGSRTITVTNTLRKTNYKFTKVAGDKTTPLKDATFAAYRDGSAQALVTATSNENGQVELNGLPVGNYTVKEIATPTGYKPAAEFNLTITDVGSSVDLKVVSSLENNKVVNNLKPTDLTVMKKDSLTGNPLIGAKFDLYRINGNEETLIDEVTTLENGKATFKKGIEPGNYKLVESEAPAGYMLMEGDFIFTITELGKVTNFKYTASDVDNNQNPVLNLKPGDDHNELQITANNLPKAPPALPRTGGMGTQIILIVGLLAVAVAGVWKFTDWRKNRGGDEDA